MSDEKQIVIETNDAEKPAINNFLKLPSPQGAVYRIPWYAGIICSVYLFIGGIASYRVPYSHGGNWHEYHEAYVATSCLFYVTILCIINFSFKGTTKRNIPFAVLPFLTFLADWKWAPHALYSLPISIICLMIIGIRKDAKRDIPGFLLINIFILILGLFNYSLLDKVQGYVLWPIGSIGQLN